MNFNTHINEKLWVSIQTTYEVGNYSHAILDAMHRMSNVLREKSGCDGDGAQLVGQALGGDSPRLKLNKFQTQSEKDEQKGIETILRGMYLGIRNPRSHEKIEDNQATAESIIYFIDYILRLLEKSEEPFVITKFISRVFDPDFVQSDRYAELLVNEIPKNKLLDTIINLYRNKLLGNIYHVGLVTKTIIEKMEDSQVREFLSIISEELNTIIDEKEIRYNLHIIPIHIWLQIQEAPRIRIENRIVRTIEEGREGYGEKTQGALATWARRLFPYFILKDKVAESFLKKLDSGNYSEENYILELFFSQLPVVITNEREMTHCVETISNGIKRGESHFWSNIIKNIRLLPDNWQQLFKEKLKDETDETNPAVFLSDGSPFLNNTFINEDDIPF